MKTSNFKTENNMLHKPPLILKDIKTLAESETVEFKLSTGRDGKGELPKDFWKSYSAMANTKGGWIILGIKEKANTFNIIGIDDIEKIKRDLFNLLNNKDHINQNLIKTEDSVHILNLQGKNVMAVYVPQANRKQKPVHLTRNPYGNTYRRENEGDRCLDDDAVNRMIAEKMFDSRDNEVLSEHFSFDEDIDHSSLNVYRNRLSAHKPDHPFLDLDLFDFFKKIGGWKKDRETGKEGITVAGLLMFGKYEVITERFPHYFLDYREPSDDRWSERIYPDGTWSGNIFDFYRKVYSRLVLDLKVPFALSGDQRIDNTLAHEALREALVNTLVHADYSEKSSILVEKSLDYFLFRNPGNLRLTKEEIWQGGLHDCRNSTLHQMFLLIGLGERAGSGIPKILKCCDLANWSEPTLIENLDSPQYTTLIISTVHLISNEILNELKFIYKTDFEKLSHFEKRILALAFSEKEISHHKCCELTTHHTRDVTLALQKLVKRKFLSSKGTSKNKVYFIPEALLGNVSEKKSSKTMSSGPSRDQVGTKSGPSRDQVGTKSGPSRDQVGTKSGPSLAVTYQEVVERLTEEQKSLVESMTGEMSIQELMTFLNRTNRTKFRQKILLPLINLGIVSMTIPDKPTSSKQKYRLNLKR